MRERSTWKEKNRVATTSRRAEDIYSMNVKRPDQPTPDQYMAADAGPDSWAETPADYEKSLIKQDYDAKGHVKRNVVGFAEFQAPTFDRPAWGDHKYDNHKFASQQKAVASHRLATSLLRTENKELVRKVAVGFMALPDAALNNALKAVADTQPAAMSDDARFKRAYACTKLAASMLTEEADEPTVERLARAIYQIDDPTLKKIIRVVATARVAESKTETPKEGSKTTAGGSKSAKGDASKHAPASHEASKTSGAGKHHAEEKWGEEEEGSESSVGGSHGTGHMSEEEEGSGSVSETDAMLAEMMGGPGSKSQAPAAPMAPAGGSASEGSASEGSASVGGPAPVMPAVAPAMAKEASVPGISFDDETETMKVSTTALEALFSDDPEVKAHRDIMAAQREQLQRVAGYSVERTASTKGAKKLGSVRAAKEEAPENVLTSLWDRP